MVSPTSSRLPLWSLRAIYALTAVVTIATLSNVAYALLHFPSLYACSASFPGIAGGGLAVAILASTGLVIVALAHRARYVNVALISLGLAQMILVIWIGQESQAGNLWAFPSLFPAHLPTGFPFVAPRLTIIGPGLILSGLGAFLVLESAVLTWLVGTSPRIGVKLALVGSSFGILGTLLPWVILLPPVTVC